MEDTEISCLHLGTSSYISNIHFQTGIFLTIDECTLTTALSSKFIVYIRFTLGVIHSVGLDKCIMTCTHHYSIMQSILTALKTLWALPIHPASLSPLVPGNHRSFHPIHGLAFSRMLYIPSSFYPLYIALNSSLLSTSKFGALYPFLFILLLLLFVCLLACLSCMLNVGRV